MFLLNLDPRPVAAGETVELSANGSVVSLGEVRVGRRRFQARRSTLLATGRTSHYVLDARGNAFLIESNGTAWSRNTPRPVTSGGAPVIFTISGDTVSVA